MSKNEPIDKNVLFDKTPSYCEDCKYVNVPVGIFPCSDCRYGHTSKFEWKENLTNKKHLKR